jgi:hypothetical protein
MGLLYQGGRYDGRGGDAQLIKKQALLTEIAREEGVLHKLGRAGATAFGAITDILLRSNAAAAGVLDVIQGTGRPGENVFGRIGRELFTSQGDREFFADVLKEGGVPRGARLSDFIQKGIIGRQFNPDIRGIVGLALDIVADPLTYVTSMTKGLGIATRGGRMFNLSKRGEAFKKQFFQRDLIRQGLDAGWHTDDSIKNILRLDEASTEWGKVEKDIFEAIRNKEGFAELREFGDLAMQSYAAKRSEFALAERIEKFDLRNLTTATKLGFDFGPFGKVPFLPTAALTAPGKMAVSFLEKASRTVGLGGLADGVIGVKNGLSDVFSRVGHRARALKAYSAMENLHHQMTTGSSSVARQLVEKHILTPEVAAKYAKTAKKHEKVWFTMQMAMENPDRWMEQWTIAADKIGIPAQTAREVVERWQIMSRNIGVIEVDNGILKRTIEGFYNPRKVVGKAAKRHADEAIDTAKLRDIGEFKADVEGFGKARSVKTIEEWVAKLGGNPAGDIDEYWRVLKGELATDPVAMMKERMTAHANALHDTMFARNVVRLYNRRNLGDDLQKTLLHTWKAFKEGPLAGKNIPEKDLKGIRSMLESELIRRSEAKFKLFPDGFHELSAAEQKAWRNKNMRGLDKVARKKLSSMTPAAKAAYMHEAMAGMTKLDEVEDFMLRFGDLLDDGVLQEHTSAIKNAMLNQNAMMPNNMYGQLFKPYRFKKGPKGQFELPIGLVKELKNFEKEFVISSEFKPLLNLFDKLTNVFKIMVTIPFPAFHIRNAYSNVFASAADIRFSAINPKMHKQAIDIMRGADGTMLVKNARGGVRRVTYEELRNEATMMGVRLDAFKLAELTGDNANDLLKSKLFRPFKGAEKLARGIENEARVLHYLTLRRRGWSPQDAAAQVKQFLFDYDDLSVVERAGFRRLFPFYTWTSKNVRRQIKNIYERPGNLAMQLKLTDAERGPEQDMLPAYLQGRIAMKLQDLPGKRGTHLVGIDIPVSNMNIIWRGGFGKTLREQLSMFNPLVKVPLELALDMDTFSGRSIRGRQWIGRMGPTLDRTLPKWMKDYLQLEKNERGQYKANGTKMYLLTKATRGKDGLDPHDALKLLTGMHIRDFDLDEAQRNRLQNHIQRLRELLLDEGIASKRAITTTPKRKKGVFE